MAQTHRSLQCNVCSLRVHIKCGDISPKEYETLKTPIYTWLCKSCDTFSFTDSFFTAENSFTPVIQNENQQTCDGFKHLNDIYRPQPDPEEDWLLPDNETEICSTGDTTVCSHTSETNYDTFENLRLLKNENRKRPIISYININSIRYKFDELKQILIDRLTDILIIAETKLDASFNSNLFMEVRCQQLADFNFLFISC